MARLLRWVASGIAITIASLAVFLLAAALFPGHPGRFYALLTSVFAGALAVLRLVGLGDRQDGRE